MTDVSSLFSALRRVVRKLSRWAWIVPGSGCTCPFPRWAADCPRHRVKSGGNFSVHHMAAHVEGTRVEVENDGGWLRIIVATDDSIKGWALSYNGRDVPIYVEKPTSNTPEWECPTCQRRYVGTVTRCPYCPQEGDGRV